MKHLILAFLVVFSFVGLMADFIILDSQPQPEYDAIPPVRNIPISEDSDYFREHIRSLSNTAAPYPPVRPVSEFDQMSGVLIRWPLGIPIELIRELSLETMVVTIVGSANLQTDARNAYINAHVNMGNTDFIIAPSDSYWTRDYGPWFAFGFDGSLSVIDFTYNRPRYNDNAFNGRYATRESMAIYNMDLVHCGGNYMTDGISVAASSHLVYEENSNNVNFINRQMEDFLGVTKYHVNQDPNATYIDHIDCWGKFLSPDTIIIRSVPTSHPQYNLIEATVDYFENQMSSWGRPYKVARVHTPNDQPYTNSLIVNDRVFVPIMNSQWDEPALQAYRDAMPGYTVIGVLNNTNNPWLPTDALHCRVKELAEKWVIQIGHTPLAHSIEFENEMKFNANILSLTGYPLNPDSLSVYYRINQGDFQRQTMIPVDQDLNDYTASISGFVPGDTLFYYLRAVDYTGISANHPFIGAAGAHWTIIEESSKPQIYHTPITTIHEEDMPVLISARVTSPLDVGVMFEYYIDDEESIVTCYMEYTENDIFEYLFDISLGSISKLFYRLRALDSSWSGNETTLPTDNKWFEVSIVTSVDDHPVIPLPLELSIYPNPFRNMDDESLRIDILSNKSATVRLSLYNIRGQKIFEDSYALAKNTTHSISWDLSKQNLSSGIYFIRYDDSETVAFRRFMVLK